MSGAAGFLAVLGVMLAIIAGAFLFGWLVWLLFRAIAALFGFVGTLIGRVLRFVGDMLSDAVALIGHALTSLFHMGAIVVHTVTGNWANSNHFGKALEGELLGALNCVWRLALGHPARLLGLSAMVAGFEQRVPEVVRRAPGPDRPSGGASTFEGYTVTGSLPGGGSGGRLWLAEPTAAKRRALVQAGRACPDRVVIKSFSLEDGSTLPQIVRENRALSAARELGLVIEHELGSRRFHYVMPWVPGEDLGTVAARLHATSGPAGLDDAQLRLALDYTADLLATLSRFHAAGLWHKDVKPGNIIVNDGRVQLVDLGLITPLASAMTLTTHGTEYFRDPEMVRLALRGVKVHEVDGVKFDLYGAGATLYAMLENNFPAHGNLSRIGKRCPEALRWIVRRAMAELNGRYATADEMLADVTALRNSAEPFGLRPVDLPSFARALQESDDTLARPAAPAAAAPRVGPPLAQAAPALDGGAPARGRLRPVFRPPLPRSRVARGVLAGVALFVALGGALIFTALSARPGIVQHHHSQASGGNVVARSNGSLVFLPDATVPAPVVPSLHGMQLLETISLDRLHFASPAAAPLPAEPVGVVLLVNDLGASAAEGPSAADVGALCTRLARARFALLGHSDAEAGQAARLVTGVDAETELALMAGARAVIGLSDPGDDEAVARLSEWLRGQTALDAVLWVGRKQPDQPAASRVVARTSRLADALRGALR